MSHRRVGLGMTISFLGLVAVGLIWYALTALGIVSRVFIPSPSAAFDSLWRGLSEGDLPSQTRATVALMINGWLLSSAVAIVLGAAIGISAHARQALEPILEFMRPLPASAVIPVAIALFGLTPGMMLGVVAFGSLWPTLLATVHGFANVEPRLREVARSLRLSRMAFVFKIGLPNAVPDILAGMRLSLTVALILAVIVEMLAGQTGLGTAILLAGRAFHSDDMFAGLILLAVIGLVSNGALQMFERRLLRWRL